MRSVLTFSFTSCTDVNLCSMSLEREKGSSAPTANILQSQRSHGRNHISFYVAERDLKRVMK